MIARRKPLKRTAIKRGRKRSAYSKRKRDLDYLRWLKTLPCAKCGRIPTEYIPNEAAHTGERAYSRKAPDRQAVVLCAHCHRTAKDSQTNRSRNWFEDNCIDLPALIARLNHCYDLQNGKETP